ncbi:unnamed protein product [Medioppia subpectinata]|uniref:Uncharacterized protein n=1 Tax=Medioppia subpectinata TaxID=1979941 RepID=A0A7R9LUQ4_9ACAR|nr:unnamed protein product [Medioppia subpectinata]CAG2121218.1 unnamed protein product [Medioppia subpectinata]
MIFWPKAIREKDITGRGFQSERYYLSITTTHSLSIISTPNIRAY